MCGLGKKNNTVICLPQNGMLVTITHNVQGFVSAVALAAQKLIEKLKMP